MDNREISQYQLQATAYCKSAIFLWLIGGWIYAALTWRLIILPAVLVFFPGIFVASLLALVLFLPSYFSKRCLVQLQPGEPKQWVLLVFATIWMGVEFIGPIAGAIGFVEVIKRIVE